MDKEQVNLHVIELDAYTTPTVSENKRDEWVCYGIEDENDAYDWLIQRYHNSPTNNAIINNMTRLIYGRGLSALNASRKPNEYAAMKALFTPEFLRATISSLKMLGDTYAQCIKTKNGKKVEKVSYITADRVRPEKCNEDGDIVAYYYSDNWEDTKKFPPKRIPAFGTSNERIELLRIKPFTVGMKYFSPVDYQGCLPYTVLEEEIGTYLINEVQNGFSGTKVVNFNNGVPSEEQQNLIKKKVLGKLTGSSGEKVIIAFNNNQESQTTVEDIPLNDAPEHYEYLSKEAEQKILIGHNVTSPMLVGVVTDNQGFSSNADEIEISAKYFYNTTIKPFQDLIIEALEQILAYNGVNGLDLYFKRLNLLESVEEDQQKKEENQLSLSDDFPKLLEELGEEENEDWELIDSREVDYEQEGLLDAQIAEMEQELKGKEKSFLSKVWEFATGVASPNRPSDQDQNIDGFYFKVRYKYVGNKSPERAFCKQMMKASKIYRKEDIAKMSAKGINRSHGHKGQPYDIFLYKGGVSCHHKWERRTYVSANKTASIGSHKTKQVSTNKARKFGYRPTNPKEVSMMPKDMPYDGHHPQWIAKNVGK
jgi:hypothetical protein